MFEPLSLFSLCMKGSQTCFQMTVCCFCTSTRVMSDWPQFCLNWNKLQLFQIFVSLYKHCECTQLSLWTTHFNDYMYTALCVCISVFCIFFPKTSIFPGCKNKVTMTSSGHDHTIIMAKHGHDHAKATA